MLINRDKTYKIGKPRKVAHRSKQEHRFHNKKRDVYIYIHVSELQNGMDADFQSVQNIRAYIYGGLLSGLYGAGGLHQQTPRQGNHLSAGLAGSNRRI